MTLIELRKQTDQELKLQLIDLAKEKFRIRFQVASGETVNYNNIRNTKKLIAQIKTLLNDKVRGSKHA